jgi:hypothetical protein
MFHGRNDPPSGDGGYRRSGRLSSRANTIRSTIWRWWLPQASDRLVAPARTLTLGFHLQVHSGIDWVVFIWHLNSLRSVIENRRFVVHQLVGKLSQVNASKRHA